jgi:hypothetical protein
MKRIATRYALTLLSALSLGTGSIWAQTVAPSKQPDTTQPAPAQNASSSVTPQNEDVVVVLDPFTVTADTEGYKATDTLGGTRVRTNLVDTPSAISVVTPKFLQDLGVTDAEHLFVYTNNTEIAGLSGNFSGVVSRGQGVSVSGAAEGTLLVNPSGVNRARGLTAMDNTRNYFLSDIPWDGFNINRVDISRGPNSFLFGVGSPSGIANVTTKDAIYKNEGSLEAKFGSFGTARESLDVNRVIIPSELAIRLDVVNNEAQYQQKPAYNHAKRVYGAIRFDPKLFDSDSAHTKIQANFENGKVESNNPRTLPPLDYVTGYLNDPKASKTGYNPWTYTMDTNISADPTASSWSGSGSLGNQYAWGNGSPMFYWDATTQKLLSAGQASYTTPTTTGYSATSNTDNVHTVGYGSYAIAQNYAYLNAHNQVDGGAFAGAYKGTVTYLDKTLSDRSVYDYYNKLIDGDNKHEWQRWNAFDVSLVQSLFNDRLVIQAVADHESYTNGQKGVLNSRTPVIVLDLNSYLLRTPTWLSGAEANPNVGRPLVFGDQGNINIDKYIRNNYQVTAAYNLDFERDFGSTSTWAKILGKDDFTALGGRYTKEEDHRSYKLDGVDSSYQVLSGNNTSPHPVDNGYDWAAYIGPDLLGTTGAGANLSNLSFTLTPPSSYPYTLFSKVWTAAATVNPTDTWTYTGPSGAVTATQADNPANYKGYTAVTVPTIYGDSYPDVLATGGNKKIQTITSKAFMYQGHFWDDVIIPTFGYRKDTTLQRGNDASTFQDQTTQIYNLNYKISDTGVKETTTSRSWGVALHLPQLIKKNLPEGTDVSLYYFHGANQTPKVRYGIDGSQLPNESGKTDDISVQIDALKGRATLRFTYFKTLDNNAAASYGQPLGNMGWKIDSIPSWTLGFAAFALAYRDQPNQLPADWPTWANGWMTDWISQHGSVGDNIATLLKTDFVKMFPQSYWDSYGYQVDVAAIQRGDWIHVAKGGYDFPSPWSFGGSHLIHGEYAIIDQNLESKGYELEATIRPTKNWDITFNASKVDATQTALGADASNYLNGMAKLFLATDLGKVAEWGGYTDYGATKTDFMANLWAPYLQQVALTGAPQPEMRRYKFNIITNYTFEHGFVKGVNVGGAFRWEDRAILGYGIKQALVYGEQGWILDVNKPIYGPTDSHFDAWIGYGHKLTTKIDWRIQLNLRNVGERVHLVTAAVEPDGSVAQQRIQDGLTWELSTDFKF